MIDEKIDDNDSDLSSCEFGEDGETNDLFSIEITEDERIIMDDILDSDKQFWYKKLKYANPYNIQLLKNKS